MSYDTQFTPENRQLLQKLQLENVDLEIITDPEYVAVVPCRISWTQTMRNPLGNEEAYREVNYRVSGVASGIVKVFVAETCGLPPERFNTGGVQMGEGRLHFGFIQGTPEQNAIFFVIHPNSWGPFQNRFRTSSMVEWLGWGSKIGFSAGGVAIGKIAGGFAGSFIPVPVVGTLLGVIVGGAVGYVAGQAGKEVVRSLVGDYLRFVG